MIFIDTVKFGANFFAFLIKSTGGSKPKQTLLSFLLLIALLLPTFFSLIYVISDNVAQGDTKLNKYIALARLGGHHQALASINNCIDSRKLEFYNSSYYCDKAIEEFSISDINPEIRDNLVKKKAFLGMQSQLNNEIKKIEMYGAPERKNEIFNILLKLFYNGYGLIVIFLIEIGIWLFFLSVADQFWKSHRKNPVLSLREKRMSRNDFWPHAH